MEIQYDLCWWQTALRNRNIIAIIFRQWCIFALHNAINCPLVISRFSPVHNICTAQLSSCTINRRNTRTRRILRPPFNVNYPIARIERRRGAAARGVKSKTIKAGNNSGRARARQILALRGPLRCNWLAPVYLCPADKSMQATAMTAANGSQSERNAAPPRGIGLFAHGCPDLSFSVHASFGGREEGRLRASLTVTEIWPF